MLQREERIQLISVLAGMYEFTDGGARDRRVLMQNAGLSRFIIGIDLTGTPRTTAGDLIARLEGFGSLPEQPAYHALGALLSYMLNTVVGELAPQNAEFIATLIIKYSLVDDFDYLNTLRDRYDLTSVANGRQSPTQLVSHFAATPEPTFKIALKDAERIEVFEKVLDDESNFLDIYLLIGAIYSAQAVCRIEVPPGQARGTGFLIGPDLILTNQHVLQNRDDVKEAIARFDYMKDMKGIDTKQSRVFQLRPDFYFSSPIEALDYALVKSIEQPLKQIMDNSENSSMLDHIRRGSHVGYLPVVPRHICERERVNIIQHPGGDPMKVVMTHNYVVENMQDTRVQYLVDTQGGSSGSPVFNNNWEVVALHHSSQFSLPDSLQAAFDSLTKRRPLVVNEGIPIKAILEDFTAKGIERYLPRK